MLNTLQVIENKLSDGYETMYLYIEDSTDYDTVTVNIKKLLQRIAIDESYEVNDDYTIYGMGINTDRDNNKLGLCRGDLFSNAAMLNVFTDEEECIKHCTNYLWELREEEGDIITLTEARKEVVNNSNGSFKYV